MHASTISAASRLYPGRISSTSRPHIDCISAASRLYLGDISQLQLDGEPEDDWEVISRLYLGDISQVQLDGEPEDDWEVIPAGNGFWRLRGEKVERLAAMTNWDYAEAQARSPDHSRARHCAADWRVAGCDASRTGAWRGVTRRGLARGGV